MSVGEDIRAYSGVPSELLEREEKERQEKRDYFTCGVLLLPSVLKKIGKPEFIGNISVKKPELIIEIILAQCIPLLIQLNINVTAENKRILFFLILYSFKTSDRPNLMNMFINLMTTNSVPAVVSVIPGWNLIVQRIIIKEHITTYMMFNLSELDTLLRVTEIDVSIDNIRSGMRTLFRYGVIIGKLITSGGDDEGIFDILESLDMAEHFPGGKNKKTKKRHSTKKQKTQKTSVHRSA
jgi:hypothetical protein